jgi:hypothetical protein
MTTITCDGLVVAADTSICHNGTKMPWGVTKIRQEEGRIFAFCGVANFFVPWVRWYLNAHRGLPVPGQVEGCCDHLWIFQDGQLLEVSSDAPHPIRIGVPSAMGSGEKYAYAAFSLGHNAEQALQAAFNCDPNTFGEKLVVVLPERLRIPAQPRYETWPNLSLRNPGTK